MAEQERMLTPWEAGRRFGVTDRTVKRWIEQGKLRGYRPGRAYQIPESAVEELLEQSEIRPKAPEPFSLEWARAATDAEFYKAIVEAPAEETDKLDLLSATMQRLSHWELRKAFANSREGRQHPDVGQRPDVAPVSPQEWPVLSTRADAVTKEVKRRRPPFARLKRRPPWALKTEEARWEVRWLIPSDQWDQHRAQVEEQLKGEEYIDVDAREEIPVYEETPLHA